MDLRPSSEQQQLIEAFGGLYADRCTPDVVQAAEPLGHSPELWRRLCETGAVEMALPEAVGGHGASLLDLALVAELQGRYVAPVPVIEAQIAGRLLARLGDTAQSVVTDVLAGSRLVTLAVRPASSGRADLVPAAAVASDAVVLDGDILRLVSVTGLPHVTNLGSQPLADVPDVAAGTELASGPAAVAAFQTAIDEWRVLTAAALSGIATRALEIAVAYVKERTAFDRPIGSFQAVAHRLADRASEVDGAQLLARQAAWAHEADPSRFAELAAMALGFTAETARDTTHDSLQYHGGYGFMVEYPIQMYFRRARSWGAVLESPQASYRRVADLQETADRGAA